MGKWEHQSWVILDGDKTACLVQEKEYATRIVACVNACEGMENPAKEIEQLKYERNAFVNKLRRLHENNALSYWGEFEVDLLFKEMGVEL